MEPVGAQTGAVTLGDVAHEFRVARCDLTGEQYDGMLISGGGSAAEQRTSVQVGREDLGLGMVQETAIVVFGSLADGDVWRAQAWRMADGRWYEDELRTTPSRQLIRIEPDGLIVEGTFRRSRDRAEREGVLRATCPS